MAYAYLSRYTYYIFIYIYILILIIIIRESSNLDMVIDAYIHFYFVSVF